MLKTKKLLINKNLFKNYVIKNSDFLTSNTKMHKYIRLIGARS